MWKKFDDYDQSHYGCWINHRGEFLGVGYQMHHMAAARILGGSSSDAHFEAIRDLGWACVKHQGIEISVSLYDAPKATIAATLKLVDDLLASQTWRQFSVNNIVTEDLREFREQIREQAAPAPGAVKTACRQISRDYFASRDRFDPQVAHAMILVLRQGGKGETWTHPECQGLLTLTLPDDFTEPVPSQEVLGQIVTFARQHWGKVLRVFLTDPYGYERPDAIQDALNEGLGQKESMKLGRSEETFEKLMALMGTKAPAAEI